MKAYIIYKFENKDKVLTELDKLLKNCDSLEPLFLPEIDDEHWKRFSKKKIAEADCAIYFLSEDSHESASIDWELDRFINLDKPIYVIKSDEKYKLNKCLYKKTTFGNIDNYNRKFYAKIVSLETLTKIINNNLELDISEEIKSNAEIDPNVSVEQYKSYLQTSEDVVARRQSVSNFYITVNATLISILSTLITILNLIEKDYSPYIVIASCILLPLMGTILCLNWRRLVYSYGQLNAAKMKVISALEKNLSFNIYDVEWQVQTDKLGKKKYVSFTKIEKFIPLLFIVIYTVIFLIGIILTVLYLVK